MLYKKVPSNFVSKMQISICYCIFDDKILFLRRNKKNIQGGTWTAPGGKIENNETPNQAICREVFEETGIKLKEDQLENTGLYYVKLSSNIHYTIQIFKTFLLFFPETIKLNLSEHDQYKWVTKEEALNLPLIAAADNCLFATFNFNESNI